MDIGTRFEQARSYVKDAITGKTILPVTDEGKIKREKECEETFLKSLEKPRNFNTQDFRKFTRAMFYLLGGIKKGKDSYSNPLIFTDRFKVKKTITFNKSRENGGHINIKINDRSEIILMPNLKHVLFEINAADTKSKTSIGQYEPAFIERVINKNIMIGQNGYPSHINPITVEFAFELCCRFYEQYRLKNKITSETNP